MRSLWPALVVCLLSLPLAATTVHDESVDGDLSSDESAPTTVDFSDGDNEVLGTVSNVGSLDPDYFHFTIEANETLVALNLLVYTPANIGFAALNAGTSSWIPDVDTSGNFLAGIHISGSMVGTDLMAEFVSGSVTTHALPSPSLGPGEYCFMIQQTSPIVNSYALQFVVRESVGSAEGSWGRVKGLYGR